MKYIICALLFFSTSSAFALYDDFKDVKKNTYDVKMHNCGKLKGFLKNEGIVRYKYQFLFGGYGVHVQSRKTCRRGYEPLAANVLAKDGSCRVGYKCREKRDDDD